MPSTKSLFKPLLFVLTLVVLPVLNASAEWAGKLPLGNHFPTISASDQEGNLRSTEELNGEHGMVFFFNRSTSW